MTLAKVNKPGYYRIHLDTTSKFIEVVSLYREFGFTKNVRVKFTLGHFIGLIMNIGKHWESYDGMAWRKPSGL